MDLEAACSEALALFQELLRIDTSNPPGNELAAAELLADSLRDDGIEVRVIESAPKRGNVVARLSGDGTGGGGLLLESHLDVVPAEGQMWSHDPFGGEIHEGYVWGRGALDMKQHAAMSVMVLKLLKRKGVRLNQDLVFAGTADEETGGEVGAGFLVSEHPDLVQAEYMLGEVGGMNMQVGKADVVPIQVAEKGRCLLKLKASGSAGHGSIPIEDSALLKLCAALNRLGKTRLPQHNTAVVEGFIRGLAGTQGFARKAALLQLLTPALSSVILKQAIRDARQRRAFWALLSNTATPTVVRAGRKENVVPQTAEATVDGRLLPGQNADDLVREVASVVGSHIDIQVLSEHGATETRPMHSRLFNILCRAVRRNAPGAVPLPCLTPGYTDAKYFSKLGIRAYGFTPARFDPSSGITYHRLFHAPDERIPVEGFNWGFGALYEVVEEFCCER